jgi:hypothetical protein
MERKVPTTQTEEIDLYLRTIYSLLRTTTDVQIRTLEEVHGGTSSSLHPEARNIAPDTSAFIYSLLRLPQCMQHVRTVVLGQNSMVFDQHGFFDVESWEVRPARARRRRCFFDGRETLACYIASRSDIDDVIPTLTAYQIEWNKLHLLLQPAPPELLSPALLEDPLKFEALSDQLQMPSEDLERLRVVWGNQFLEHLVNIRSHKQELRVRLLNGSLSEYWRATRGWMDNIVAIRPELMERPVYFISSNTHSVANLLSGFAIKHRDELIDYLERKDNRDLLAEWQGIQERHIQSSEGNFLYYILKKYQSTPKGSHLIEAQRLHEEQHGITRIPSEHSFDVEAQVIDLSKLDTQWMDERLSNGCCTFLKDSNALILNIDYPLGLAAYNLLAKVTEYVNHILGVYVMGKAASLNGVIGDVMIPNVVQDEHSRNTYLFQNAFSANDVIPYLVYGTVLDNQKAVSVLGTFLQNARIMDVFYREGYTDFEMEAGPYLSAVYEMVRPKRHPVDEIVNLYGAPFDLGILHYVSDTPLSKGKNLGAGTLSYFGMDSTYATTLAILRRILQREEGYLERKRARAGS